MEPGIYCVSSGEAGTFEAIQDKNKPLLDI